MPGGRAAAGPPLGTGPPPLDAVAAVVLAAGAGARFAGDTHKLLTPFRGRPLAAWALDAALGAGVGAVVVVTGACDLAPLLEGRPVHVVHNPRWDQGQATSLAAGLAWCAAHGYEAAVVGLADQPLVPASAWRAVAAAPPAPMVAAEFAGARRPPVRIARELWPLLPTSGDEGARAFMRRRPDLVEAVACDGDPADVDTLDDLRRHAAGATGT